MTARQGDRIVMGDTFLPEELVGFADRQEFGVSKRGVKTEYVAGSMGTATSQERNTEGGRTGLFLGSGMRKWQSKLAACTCQEFRGERNMRVAWNL